MRVLRDTSIIQRKSAFGHITKGRISIILFRKQRIGYRPSDTDGRITPKDSSLALWCVKVTAFIVDECGLAEDTEAMRKSGWDIELAFVLFRQDNTHPFAKTG
jgi:hypothetical protein